MRILKLLPSAALALLALVFLAPATSAHAQGPAYLHALSDLRSARAYLQYDTRPAYAGHRDRAIEQIDKAINDIKVAAMDDGKNPWHTPPPQSGGSEGWPIHSAYKLLNEAKEDVNRGHDLPQNQGLRERATEHIDRALDALRSAM
jgi:tetratricopeptide (TPR) repeat protein